MPRFKSPPRAHHLGLVAALSLALAALEWTSFDWNHATALSYHGAHFLEMELPPASVPKKPVPPNRRTLIAPIIVPDPPKPEPSPFRNPDPLKGKIQPIDYTDEWGEGGVDAIETVFIAEHMPRFESCTNVIDQNAERMCTESQIIRILQGCAKFPPQLINAGIGGVVYLQFIVDERGHAGEPTILKSAHPALDRAALHALDCIPPLIPGTQQGKAVRVLYTIPIRFTIR